jgi:carbamoyl-phosphate synthase large subunit
LETKTVLVTGIGGNVGQGIIRNILSTSYPIIIVGTNISDFSAGNHLVDSFYKVPFGYDGSYIPRINEIIKKERVDLIISSTDFESYYLAIHKEKINCQIAGSDIEASEIYLDKYLTYIHHKSANIPFAESCLPSEFKNQFSKSLAKPRKGRGSKGLIFNVKDVSCLSDEEYMIQEMHSGIEITSAVYRRYKDGLIHGIISMERSLENGATTYCKVTRKIDAQVLNIAQDMCNNMPGLKGAFNIQSIVKNNEEVVPFEINCRISGTNSIRASFGFKDVNYTIEELLWGFEPQRPLIIQGVAYRILTDVIYTDSENLKGNNQDEFKLF